MSVKILPKTKLGKWSVLLTLLMPILFSIGFLATEHFYSDVSAGKSIMEDIVSRPAVSLPMLTGFFSGIAAFITGIISVVKKSERSFLVYISTAIGLLLIFFLFTEILFPH